MFLGFDTSSIPDGDVIDSVVLSIAHFTDNTATVTNVVEVRAYDWGTAVETTDWIPGANLGSSTLLATATSSPGNRFGTGYKDFTSQGAFAAAINKTGFTRVVICTDRMRLGTVPTDDETIHPFYAEKTGTSQDPKLVVTHHAP